MKEIIQILFSENASSRMLATIFSKLTENERSIFIENLLKYDRLDFFQLFSSGIKDKKSFNKWLMDNIFIDYTFSHLVGFHGAMKILNFLLLDTDVDGSWIITRISKYDLLKGFVDSPLKGAIDNVEEYLSQFPEKYSPGNFHQYDYNRIDANLMIHKFRSVEMCKKMLVHIERILGRNLTGFELTSIAAANYHKDDRHNDSNNSLEILTFIFDLYNQRSYNGLVTNFQFHKHYSEDYDFHLLSILMKYASGSSSNSEDSTNFSTLRYIFVNTQKCQKSQENCDDVLFQFAVRKISLEKILSIDVSSEFTDLVNLSISRVAQVTEQLHSSTNLISPIVDIILLYL